MQRLITKNNKVNLFEAENIEDLIAKLWIFKDNNDFCFSLSSSFKETKPIIYDTFVFLRESMLYLHRYSNVYDYEIREYSNIKEAYVNSFS